MSIDVALRLTEILLGLAVLQQSLEHLVVRSSGPKAVFAARAGLSVGLLVGCLPGWAALGLAGLGLVILARFDGPYNGGADRMTLLALICLSLAHMLPTAPARELALGYLAVQLVLSYVVSGWVKVRHRDWRTGRALADVFAFSAYPVSEDLRGLARRPRLLRLASWGVIGFELGFPLVLISVWSVAAGLIVALTFHIANAALFGLNRFVWAWLAAFPALIWLQHRLFDVPTL